MESFAWNSDGWQPVAGVPLSDRGFRHGMSAFATLRMHRGRLVALTEHLEKLRQTCLQLGLRPPPDADALWPMIEEGIARITVTAGDGNFRDPLDQGRIFLTLDAAPLRPPPQTLHLPESNGTRMDFSSGLLGLKTGNYWPQIDAFRHSAQCDETAIINSHQHVVSASLGNLFAVIDGLLLTPRTSSGARSGVTRDWVLAREEVIVSDFHPDQLREATEIFLTSSGYGIAPVIELDGRPVASQSIGTRLKNEYQLWLET